MTKKEIEDLIERIEMNNTAAIESAAEAAATKVLIKTGALSATIDFTEIKKNYPHSIAQKALKSQAIEWKRKGTGGPTCGQYCSREQFLKIVNTL